MMSTFLEAAFEFAHKVDRVVRKAFGIFSSTERSNDMSHENEQEGQEEPESVKYEVTSPPRAYVSKHKTPKRHSHRRASERIETDKESVQRKEGNEKRNSDLQYLVIKEGHVRNLVKMYDEISDVSSESFTRGSKKQDSVLESFRQDSFSVTPRRNLARTLSFCEERKIDKVVTVPPKVASASTIIRHNNMASETAGSDCRITLFEEAEMRDVEDSLDSEDNAVDTQDFALQRRRERRTFWSMFCIPMW